MRSHHVHLATVSLACLALAACGEPMSRSDASVVDAAPPPDAPPGDVIAEPDTPSTPDARPDAPPDAAADAAAPDVVVPPPARCASAVPIAGGVLVDQARLRLGGAGVYIAWAPRGGSTVAIQSFSLELEPQAEPLVLPVPGGTGGSLDVAFFGDAGLVAAGSSIFVVQYGAGSRLTMTAALDVAPRVVRHVWHAGAAANIRAVTADGAMVFSNGTRVTFNEPNAPLSDPIGPSASVFPTLGGYRVFEMRETAGGPRFQMREFVTGHGVVLETRNEFGDGVSASRVVAPGDGLYRLVYTGEREVDVALERRDEGRWTLAGAPALLQRGAAWYATSGAVSYGMFMAWASRSPAGGYNSVLNTQWDPASPTREAYRSDADRALEVFGAESDRFRLRAWALFGERDPAGGARLLARCLER